MKKNLFVHNFASKKNKNKSYKNKNATMKSGRRAKTKNRNNEFCWVKENKKEKMFLKGLKLCLNRNFVFFEIMRKTCDFISKKNANK